MSYCTLYTFGGVPASWQLISPPRCSNPPNRSSEPVCSRGLLPRPPLSWREDKPRPHRAPHPMSLATVLLLTWPPSLGKPAWIHHMGCKVKKEMYTKLLSGSVLNCSSRFFIFGFCPPTICHSCPAIIQTVAWREAIFAAENEYHMKSAGARGAELLVKSMQVD